MDILLGFDPGGAGRFGWCVSEYAERLPLTVRETGCATTANEAIASALEQLREGERPIGVGIDAPMYWVGHSGRRVDQELRKAVRLAGANHAAGRVQHVNSLRGACVAQGMLVAAALRDSYPDLIVSECHPKAFLFLVGHDGSKGTLRDHLRGVNGRNEHARDAAVSCLSAWAAIQEPQDWHDLAALDPEQYSPVSPVTYWMPRWDE